MGTDEVGGVHGASGAERPEFLEPGRPELLELATAICQQLELATRNVADFEGTGVVVVNPWVATAP